ncbi:MAG TPA: hypothetical protein VGN63_04145 [Flavisolibacter sp.]|jgi:hypothetical protein|nr:hypothetical protein [Flavisolibacter sp.]
MKYITLPAFFFLFVFIMLGCQKKDETPVSIIEVTAKEAIDINVSSATIKAEIAVEGNVSIVEKGVCWNTQSSPTINNNFTKEGSGLSPIHGLMTGLQPATTYYVRAYCTSDQGQTSYSNEITFTTLQLPALNVTTGNATGITATTATVTGSISGTGNITARGICWSTSQNPTINNNKTANGTGNFTASLTGLTAATTYYARAYATTSSGTIYGNQISFSTLANTLSVVTGTVNIYGYNVHMTFTSTGTATIITQGIVFSKSQNPTINSSKVIASRNITGTHSLLVAPLAECTKYYARAFATLAGGTTVYGNEVSFKSPGNPLNDCHPFNGYWGFTASNPNVLLQGSASGFKFHSIGQTTSSTGWAAAYKKGLISIGTLFLKDIAYVNTNTWKCTALWNSSTASQGVTEVKYSQNATLVLSADEKTLTLTSKSPFDGSTVSGTLYRH